MIKSTLSRKQLVLLLITQAMVVLPILTQLPLAVSVYWFITLCWRTLIFKHVLVFPKLFTKVTALLAGISVLLFSIGDVFSLETFVAFFVVVFSLKLVELHNKDDGSLILTLTFIALGVVFIFHQGMLMTVYALLCLVLVLYAWSSLYRTRAMSHGAGLRIAAASVAVTLPLMVLLFVMMPRLGQLWTIPQKSSTGSTGFSRSMSPGTFSELIQSDVTAFRVTPESGELPRREQLYWRGLTFETFDGVFWREHTSRERLPRSSWTQIPKNKYQQVEVDAPIFKYSVLLEPHQQKILFNLLTPLQSRSASMAMQFRSDQSLMARNEVTSRIKYTTRSSLADTHSLVSLPVRDRNINTALPKNTNQRTRTWASELRARYGWQGDADKKIIAEIMSQFNSEFSYTLKPPLMPSNSVDAFLFEHKRGFCEHFSSSFVFALRAADIPARVVVGYQGGEYNRAENYILVRQRDAHAWAEVWLDGLGWQRVDPTAAVAPERIERGLFDSVSASEQEFIGAAPSRFQLVNWARAQVEILNYRWQVAVLNFDNTTQSSLFNKLLGGNDAWRTGLLFVIGLVIFTGIYILVFSLAKRPVFEYEESKLYDKHLKRLAHFGYHKAASETPLAFAQRVGGERPEWRKPLLKIAHLFNEVSYQSRNDAKDLLSAQVRGWKPK